MNEKISAFNKSFWDLWIQKVFRNLASMKFFILLIFIAIVAYGMFTICPVTNLPWISASLGLGFLGLGFVTVATSRIVANTRLTENKPADELDCDK